VFIFCRLKINYDTHEFDLKSGTIGNRFLLLPPGVPLPHFNNFQSFSHHHWQGTKNQKLEKSNTDFDWPDSEDDKLETKQRTLEDLK
jgi:hypothetical protein